MIAARIAAAAAIAMLSAAPSAAQPAASPGDTGFIGRGAARLEIDDCPPADPTASEEQITARFTALFDRGTVLYAQGDYPGAVREFIAGYCLAGGIELGRARRYSLLRDIGQAYERSLDFEQAIAYFERFMRDYPRDADAAPRKLLESRVAVLQGLRAQIVVQTLPGGANVTISNEGGVAGVGRAGKPIEVFGGKYTMLVELPGYEPHTEPIEVRIGKPFAFVVPLRPLQGRLSAQIEPADAKVFLRDGSVERFVGVGRVDEVLPVGKYVLVADAPDRRPVERPVEVLPNRVNRLQIDLPPRPQFGRRQLVAFATGGGAISVASLLYAFEDDKISGAGVAAGGAMGLLGSLLYLPDQVPLGTSNLTITAGLAGAIAGGAAGWLFTDTEQVSLPIVGATTVLGAGLGYYVGRRTEVSVGDAALFNSSVLWGTAVGGMFALSFGGEQSISAGLTLSGFGVGAAGGVLMGRYYEVSRRRMVLIDIGGVIGVIGGIAAKGLAYPEEEAGSEAYDEHIANFMLGGAAVGLISAGILTRDLDAPKIPVKPAIGVAPTAGGGSIATYGVAGAW